MEWGPRSGSCGNSLICKDLSKVPFTDPGVRSSTPTPTQQGQECVFAWMDGQNRAPPRTRHRVPCPWRRDAEGVVLAPVQRLSAVAGTRCRVAPLSCPVTFALGGRPGARWLRCCGCRRGGEGGPAPSVPVIRKEPAFRKRREAASVRLPGPGFMATPGSERSSDREAAEPRTVLDRTGPRAQADGALINCPPRPCRRVQTTVPRPVSLVPGRKV